MKWIKWKTRRKLKKASRKTKSTFMTAARICKKDSKRIKVRDGRIECPYTKTVGCIDIHCPLKKQLEKYLKED